MQFAALDAPRRDSKAEALDVAKIHKLQLKDPRLLGPGIERVDAFDRRIRLRGEVGMGDCQSIVVDNASDALGTCGVAVCYAVCARGVTADGKVVLSLGHYSRGDGEEVMDQHALMMREHGAAQFEVYVVGGQLSRCIEPLEMSEVVDDDVQSDLTGTLDRGMELVEAAGERLRGAVIDASEFSEADIAAHPEVPAAPPSGRPECVSVVITRDGVLYAADSAGDHALEALRNLNR